MHPSSGECTVAALVTETRDPQRLAAFWGGMLGREPVVAGDAIELPGSPTQPTLRFVRGTKYAWGGPPLNPKAGRNRHRLALAATDVDAALARLLALGARRVDGPGGSDPAGGPRRQRARARARSGRADAWTGRVIHTAW